MAGFVSEVKSIWESVDLVFHELRFPWPIKQIILPLPDAVDRRVAGEIFSHESVPAFSRSLRDGYAVRAFDTAGASSSSPVFLRTGGQVSMAEIPAFAIAREQAASIPTGGALPEGADAVVMQEDVAAAGEWLEVRKSVQVGENVTAKGEEISAGDAVVANGTLVDHRSMGILSTLGFSHVSVFDPVVRIVSTGDEIVPVETRSVSPGCVRDANAWILKSLLHRYGFHAEYAGIVRDDRDALDEAIRREMTEADVVIVSGGSSVGVRDHTTRIMESLAEPGLMVRGINMVPGKPTLIAGERERKKLIVGLPGHPMSCLVTGFFVLLPVLLQMIGATIIENKVVYAPLLGDVVGRTGPEEFVPMRLAGRGIMPLPAKSGYVSALLHCDGFIRLPENQETLRKGEKAEAWLW